MNAKAVTVTEREIGRLDLRVAWLCGLVLLLEGYDIAAVGYAIPSIADTWRLAPSAFTPALTAGNVGLLLGSIGMGLLGDRLGRKPMLISCVVVFGAFSLFSALVDSPFQLATLRFLTGLGLGGGIPLAVALASDFARPMMQGRHPDVGGSSDRLHARRIVGEPARPTSRLARDFHDGWRTAVRDNPSPCALVAGIGHNESLDKPR
jgi:hypothetical protein